MRTVADLIARLQKLPPDAVVLLGEKMGEISGVSKVFFAHYYEGDWWNGWRFEQYPGKVVHDKHEMHEVVQIW
jgi:hypothetical protein